MISTARTCNLILIVLDCLKPMSHKRLIEHELEGFGIRLNKKPPGITFRKKEKGGINFTSTLNETKMDLDGAQSSPFPCIGDMPDNWLAWLDLLSWGLSRRADGYGIYFTARSRLDWPIRQ